MGATVPSIGVTPINLLALRQQRGSRHRRTLTPGAAPRHPTTKGTIGMRKTILGIAAFATIATPLAIGSAANAYTMDAKGVGFVGKGEVQSAFGLNNSAMQTAVDKGTFKFSTSQGVSQAFSQTATQTGTQAISQSASQTGTQTASQTATQTGTQTATQDVTQTLSCVKLTGQSAQQVRHGVRTAERSATRTATHTTTREATREATRTTVRTAERDGTRTGSRAGVQTGNVTSDVAYENKKTGQYTGFNLKGV